MTKLWDVECAVDELHDRQVGRRYGDRLSSSWPELDLPTGYEIQLGLLERMRQDGHQTVGVKLGLTSPAKQRRMGIDTPLTAWLTDRMAVLDGATVPLHQLIHPRVEPEIVFILARDLQGPGISAEAALDAVGRVHGGLEVIDSRYRDFDFLLPDVVADNASSALFAITATGVPPDSLDLIVETCHLSVDDEVVATGTGADVQGDPAAALALAANSLGERGITLEAGWMVLTGGMTDAVPLADRQVVRAEFDTLGSLAVVGGHQ